MSNKKDKLDITKIVDTYSKVESNKSEADEMFQDLRTKIWHGETTGDSIKDFIITWNNKIPTSEDEKPYRDLEYELNHSINEPVLIVSKIEGIEGCPGIIPPAYINPMFLRITTKYSFGVVKKETEFKLKEGGIYIPMNEHLEYKDKYGQEKWNEVKGHIFIHDSDFKNLNKNVIPRHTPMANNGSERFQHGMHIYFREDALLYLQGAFDKLPVDSIGDTFISKHSQRLKILNDQALEWMKK